MPEDPWFNHIKDDNEREMARADFADSIPYDERIHTKNKSKYEERRMGINTGWTVMLCNDMNGVDVVDINYEFYIAEAMKLVVPVRGW